MSTIGDVEIARALHVLSVAHWIGGVAFVTLVVLPLGVFGAWQTRANWRTLIVLHALFGSLVLSVVLFSPSSRVQASLVLHLVDVLRVFTPDSWIDFTRAEVVMNAVIIAPLSFLGSIVWPRLRWQDWTAYAFLRACTADIPDRVLLPRPQPRFSPIVANAATASPGALL